MRRNRHDATIRRFGQAHPEDRITCRMTDMADSASPVSGLKTAGMSIRRLADMFNCRRTLNLTSKEKEITKK